jgi:hypothetical protein
MHFNRKTSPSASTGLLVASRVCRNIQGHSSDIITCEVAGRENSKANIAEEFLGLLAIITPSSTNSKILPSDDPSNSFELKHQRSKSLTLGFDSHKRNNLNI